MSLINYTGKLGHGMSYDFLPSDSVDEALDHVDQESVLDDVFRDELLAHCRQAYKNLLQVCVGPSLEACADRVAASSCVVYKFFGYTFVIHKISQLQKKG